jgi:hypothetical protein
MNAVSTTAGVAGTEGVRAAEYGREHHVPIQAAVWRATLGAGRETQLAEAVVKCAALNRTVQLGMPEAVRVG